MTEAAVAEKKDVVPSQYREKYKESGGTCGDFIAIALHKIAKDGPESLDSVKTENGIEASRWATFNPGMQRMNLANVLRGKFLKGETIVLLGKHHNAKDQVERDFNHKLTDDPKSMLKVAKFLELQENDRTAASLQALFFPKAKGPSAEERAKAKAEKDAAAAKAKQDKADEKAKAKAEKDAIAAKAKADKDAEKAKAKADKEVAAALAKSEKADAAAKAKAEKEAAAAAKPA